MTFHIVSFNYPKMDVKQADKSKKLTLNIGEVQGLQTLQKKKSPVNRQLLDFSEVPGGLEPPYLVLQTSA